MDNESKDKIIEQLEEKDFMRWRQITRLRGEVAYLIGAIKQIASQRDIKLILNGLERFRTEVDKLDS